jgi:hypothetical protein
MPRIIRSRLVRKALAQTSQVCALEDLSEGFDHLNGVAALVAYAESAVAAEILCDAARRNLRVRHGHESM